MKNEEIVNAVKSFRDFIMFKYKSENTAKNYGSAVAHFLGSFKDVSRPSDINADMIIKYLMQYENLSTRRNAHSAIKLFCRNIFYLYPYIKVLCLYLQHGKRNMDRYNWTRV